MKKIISCTLATAISVSPLASFNGEVVGAVENEVNLNENGQLGNNVEVKIEDTEKIENIIEGGLGNNEEVEVDSNVEINTEVEEEKSELDKIVTEENKVEDIKIEEKKEDAKVYANEITGKIELDINFAIPIINSDKIDMKVALGKDGVDIGTINIANEESGILNSEISYEVEKLNSKRQPLEAGQSEIYFLRILIKGLSLGNYNTKISGNGYVDANVENIEIEKHSKRIRLGSSNNKISENDNYNGVFLAGDVNDDNVVDMTDYEVILKNIGTKNSKYDLNRDSYVDIGDLTYVNDNIGKIVEGAEIINIDAIVNPDNVEIDTTNIIVSNGANIKDILVNSETAIEIGKADGQAPTVESPLKIEMDFLQISRNINTAIDMQNVVIKSPAGSEGAVTSGILTYTDIEGNLKSVAFNEGNIRKTSGSDNIVIDLGSQVAVKKISIDVTGNRGNKNISEIAQIEFLNNVYKELPKPNMNIPEIKTVETSTNLHDERITLTWEPEQNVSAYEVKYEKLDSKGNVTKTKKLQTNRNSINILDKDIKPYDLYRVSIQSLNGSWESGYEVETGKPEAVGHIAFDGKADNVDANFNPLDSYYNGYKGTVSEIQVIPRVAPQEPINIVTEQGYRSFSLTWENHSQARDFDIYYRKIGSENKKWVKANDNKIEVDENSEAVINPDKSKLVRAHSYTINGLEDRASYEVRLTATNHLGTSKMSKTYIGSTEELDPPKPSEYNLINRAEENEIGTSHITNVENTESGASQVDSKNAVVDNDYGSSWLLNDWDSGMYSDRGPTITFDKEYTMDTIVLVPNLQKGVHAIPYMMEIHYWDKDGNKKTTHAEKLNIKISNGRQYLVANMKEPIVTSKIQVNPSVYGGNKVSISELKFYEYDSLEKDVRNLYNDELMLTIKDDVTQEKIDKLLTRVNTVDPISNEYHPNKEIILKELEIAQSLFNDKNISNKIVTLDSAIRNDNVGPSLGVGNDWQSLGSVARPGKNKDGKDEEIVVYMGSNDPNAKVEITFLQSYGLPGQYKSSSTIVKSGRTEIAIPEIISADVEKGGVVMARVVGGKTDSKIQLRLSNTTDIPHLNVNNIINDKSKEVETKEIIRTYIENLNKYVKDIPSKYPDKVSNTDKINNIYLYDEVTSPLNSTDIEGDRFTLTVPATQILKGIESGLGGNIDAQIERVYNAMLAWEQEVQVAYAKKGVYEEAKDFNGNGTIDKDETDIFNKHKAPLNRVNIKYQRMIMGAAAYASSHHIGVGYGSTAGYIQGVPYKFDENKNIINNSEAHLYGALIGHEIGHAMDISDRTYDETSNNLLALITDTMDDRDSSIAESMPELYKKVTSNTMGLSTNRSVVLGMLWQPYLAYEDDSTSKMLFTDNDSDMSNDSYFAKLNRAYREMTAEERKDGDRDQYLIRMTSKVAKKDLSGFYLAHGIKANATTMQYVSQFPKETRAIQYINDKARRERMAGTANMEVGTALSATFGVDESGVQIVNGSYVNQKNVPLNLSVDKSNDKILGYEIYRNGIPVGFMEKDTEKDVTIYNDIIDTLNNRVFEYSAVAYDYNLNKTNTVDLGTVKVRHDGGVDSGSISLKTNTVDKVEENNDIHGDIPNKGLANMLDSKIETVYEGRKLSKEEYNPSVHGDAMNPKNNPYIIMDVNKTRSLVGIKYTAPTTKSGFIFKSDKLAKGAIDKYIIEVSTDGEKWTKVNEGKFNINESNPTETIYFNKEGVEGGKQLNAYNTRYVKLTAVGASEISAAEIGLVGPAGDNIEIGVAQDNVNYENGLGILKEEFVYQLDNAETPDINEMAAIPKGSIIITGEYSGNPAFNVPLVLNQSEEHIANKYNGILMADIPNNGNLEEISEGNWIYWVEPQDAANFMKDNEKIFAELYRTDSADASTGGQRLVSDTFKIVVPDTLPEISLNSRIGRSNETNKKVIKIDENKVNSILENR